MHLTQCEISRKSGIVQDIEKISKIINGDLCLRCFKKHPASATNLNEVWGKQVRTATVQCTPQQL